MCGTVAVHDLLPGVAPRRPARADLGEFPLHLLGDVKRAVFRPAVGPLGQPHFVRPQRLAVGLEGVLLVRAPEPDVRARHDKRGPALLGAGCRERRVDRGHVHPVHVLDVPAVCREARPDVFREGDVGGRREGNAVRVVEHDQPAEMQVAGERCRFGGNALHQVPVARDDVGPVVDDRVTRPVERGGQPAFRHRHPDGIAEPLAERPRGHLDARAAPTLRMPRRSAAPAPEVLEIVQREVVPRQKQQAVEQHAPVPRREDEPVAIGPFRLCGVMPEVSRPQHVGHRGGAHWHSRMS